MTSRYTAYNPLEMQDTVHEEKKENRKFLIWFIIAVLIAVLPWFFLLD